MGDLYNIYVCIHNFIDSFTLQQHLLIILKDIFSFKLSELQYRQYVFMIIILGIKFTKTQQKLKSLLCASLRLSNILRIPIFCLHYANPA